MSDTDDGMLLDVVHFFPGQWQALGSRRAAIMPVRQAHLKQWFGIVDFAQCGVELFQQQIRPVFADHDKKWLYIKAAEELIAVDAVEAAGADRIGRSLLQQIKKLLVCFGRDFYIMKAMFLGVEPQGLLLITARNHRNAHAVHGTVFFIGGPGIGGHCIEQGAFQAERISGKIILCHAGGGFCIGAEQVDISCLESFFKVGRGVENIGILPAGMIGYFTQIVSTIAGHAAVRHSFQKTGIVHIANPENRGGGSPCPGRICFGQYAAGKTKEERDQKKQKIFHSGLHFHIGVKAVVWFHIAIPYHIRWKS